jgi:hypothetical protein
VQGAPRERPPRTETGEPGRLHAPTLVVTLPQGARESLHPGAAPLDDGRGARSGAAAPEGLLRGRYLMAIGLMIACTAPVMREGPSVNRNSQAWSFTISSVFMFSRM